MIATRHQRLVARIIGTVLIAKIDHQVFDVPSFMRNTRLRFQIHRRNTRTIHHQESLETVTRREAAIK